MRFLTIGQSGEKFFEHVDGLLVLSLIVVIDGLVVGVNESVVIDRSLNLGNAIVEPSELGLSESGAKTVKKLERPIEIFTGDEAIELPDFLGGRGGIESFDPGVGEQFGLVDDLEHVPAGRRHGTLVRKLEGQPVRLRFAMEDADLYSFSFRP